MGLSCEQWRQLGQAVQLASVVPLDLERIGVASRELSWVDPGVEERPDRQATQALRRLEPGLREVVRRVVLEGRSYRNVAALLQVSPMTVQRRLHRGLALLRQELNPAGAPWCHPAPAGAAAC